MNSIEGLAYADRLGQFFASYSIIPPVAGRVLGYLMVCRPEWQSVNELASALKASRSAIVGAVQVLENRRVIKRTRIAGDRNDLISFDIVGFENRGFDAKAYLQMATLFEESLTLVESVPAERQSDLQELIYFAKFLAERMPILQEEWHKQRDAKRTT